MGLKDTYVQLGSLNGISVEDLVAVYEALSEAFPMIVLGNLTQNTYTMVKDEGFLADTLPPTGKYDDLITYGAENIHPTYQQMFLDLFSRENLLHAFEQGKNEISVKLYQKGRGKSYQWVSAKVFRVKDKNGDIREISIHKTLRPDQNVRRSGADFDVSDANGSAG